VKLPFLKGDIMKAKKYWILVIVLTMLCITEFCAKKTVARGTPSGSYKQWEYGNYLVITGGDTTGYSWTSPEGHISTVGGSAHQLWIECGFKSKSKDVLLADWFNFLGKKGWELTCIDIYGSISENASSTNYWFKRPK